MPDDILKSVWPDWQIVKRLGRGSYGVVYEAVRRRYNLESRAAIKVISVPQEEAELDSLRSDGLTDGQSRTYLRRIVDDFVREIDMMRRLQGAQNVVFIEDYEVVESEEAIRWDICVRMELLTPLSAYAAGRPGGILSQDEVIRLGIDICKALEACEKLNIIHRDIKPENILVNETFGLFKLGDFGVARQLEGLSTGLSIKGTPNYMAPEVYSGQPYDERADLYSLGLVLHRLTNRNSLPFTEPGKKALMPDERNSALRRRMNGEALPAPIDATPALSEVILRACAHDPAARYASAKAMREALERLQSVADDDDVNYPSLRDEGGTMPLNAPRGGGAGEETLPFDAPENGGTVWINGTHAPAKDEGEEAKTEKKPKKLLAVALAVVFVAAIGLGVIWSMRHRGDRPAGAGATAEPTAALFVEATATEKPTATPTARPTATPVPTSNPTPRPQPTATPAQKTLTYGDWDYETDNGGCVILKYNGKDADVSVPEKIDGMKVTEIAAHAFSYNTSLESVTIPDSVTELGSAAFSGCSSLISVTLPDGLWRLPNLLFSGCRSLLSITIPDSVSLISANAFANCHNLLWVTIPGGVTKIDDMAFYGCEKLLAVTYMSSLSDWEKVKIGANNEDLTTAVIVCIES